MIRKNVKSVYYHSIEHFLELIRALGDRAVVMQSVVDGNVASANIFVLGRKHVWFKYSGLDPRYRNSGAHTYAMDRVIHWAWQSGYEHFMLGGGIEPGDSTYMSKHGFSHATAAVHHFRKVHDPRALNMLLQAKRAYDQRLGRETKEDYFPSYWLL